MRIAGSLALAVGVAWLGGQVLGEYPFRGPLPLIGAALLGVIVVGVISFGWRGTPPAWAIVLAAGLAAGGEAIAVSHDTAGLRPWPTTGYAAVAVAALAALVRLIADRPPRRAPADDAERPASG